ncbi:cdk2 [Symbiodinium sp. CCMP2592]|nr:cdk2 [Symbiodinium sp. CCMP2592]
MGMPGKSPLLLSMLGVALSPGSRLYLKKTDQGLKHFLAQHPQEFYVDGSKGREVITYLRAPGNKLGLAEFAVDPAQIPASAGPVPKATMEVPKVTLQLPSNEPASEYMPAESPKNMGNRYLPTSPLPPGSVGSNCGNLGTRRGNASNGPATGNLSDLGGFPPTPGWDDMVPPESPKATNLLPTDQTPVCTNHPGMQTPSDWGTPWDSVKPWDVRHPAKLGGQADLNNMGAGPSTDNGATAPNMFTQAWSAWGMPPPAMWPGQAAAFSGNDASQEALQNLLQMSGGMPSADPSQGVPAALLSYLAMGNPQGGLPNATWMDMNQLHAMQLADHDGQAGTVPLQDILAWMAKYDVVDRIMECKQNNGKPMGLAVIAMNSKEDADFVRQALHGQYMGNRYIEVFPHLEAFRCDSGILTQGQDTIICCVSWSKPESSRGALKKTELLASVLHWPDVVAPEVQIGKGAWGKVFAARFHESTMKCALKCKRHDQNDCQGNDFFHEAEIMRKLRHPFVARVIFTSCSPVPAIAFELLGSSLEESTTVHNIPNAGLCDAFGCAMAGMSYLHSVQIAHRDICPRNMVHLNKDMKSKGWKLKLVDFDSSENLDEQSRHGPGSLYFAPLIFGGWCRMALDRYALGMSFKEIIEHRGSSLSSNFAVHALVVMDELMTGSTVLAASLRASSEYQNEAP